MVRFNKGFSVRNTASDSRRMSLRDLKTGRAARVNGLSDDCQGFERARLLDLGLAPGVRVQRAYQAPFGGPIAYRVRGVTLALRPEQAARVAVELEA